MWVRYMDGPADGEQRELDLSVALPSLYWTDRSGNHAESAIYRRQAPAPDDPTVWLYRYDAPLPRP